MNPRRMMYFSQIPKGDLNVVNESISDVTSEDSGHKQDPSGLLNDSSPTNDGLEEGPDGCSFANAIPESVVNVLTEEPEMLRLSCSFGFSNYAIPSDGQPDLEI